MLVTADFIKHLRIDECDLTNLLFIQVQLGNIIEGFKKQNFSIPDYISEKYDMLNSEIEVRLKAEKLRKLRILKIKREGLSTREEQRSKMDAEIAALEKELQG